VQEFVGKAVVVYIIIGIYILFGLSIDHLPDYQTIFAFLFIEKHYERNTNKNK